MEDYKEFKRKERLEFIEYLRSQIDNLYADEKIKEEKLIEYTEGLVKELRRTSFIKLFADTLAAYMPKYNELKHFNAKKISAKFLEANNLKLEPIPEETLTSTQAIEPSAEVVAAMQASEVTGDQPLEN